MTINKQVKKLTLTIQAVKDAENKGEEVDAIFGSLDVFTDEKQKKFKRIDFVSRLSETKTFEKHIKNMITTALQLEENKEVK